MRTEKTDKNEITTWFPLATYRLGIKNMGEFQMGSEWAKILILNSRNEEVINLGNLAFASFKYLSFFVADQNAEYIILSWMFAKKNQSRIVPIVINIQERSFVFVDNTKILHPIDIWTSQGKLFCNLEETKWINGKAVKTILLNEINKSDFQPIEQFYDLDENTLKVATVRWIDKNNAETVIE